MATIKLIKFATFVSKYEDAFQEIKELVNIACTIPVTSVQSERSFSCLKLIKTHVGGSIVKYSHPVNAFRAGQGIGSG